MNYLNTKLLPPCTSQRQQNVTCLKPVLLHISKSALSPISLNQENGSCSHSNAQVMNLGNDSRNSPSHLPSPGGNPISPILLPPQFSLTCVYFSPSPLYCPTTSHHDLRSALLGNPSNWSPCFHSCFFPIPPPHSTLSDLTKPISSCEHPTLCPFNGFPLLLQ